MGLRFFLCEPRLVNLQPAPCKRDLGGRARVSRAWRAGPLLTDVIWRVRDPTHHVCQEVVQYLDVHPMGADALAPRRLDRKVKRCRLDGVQHNQIHCKEAGHDAVVDLPQDTGAAGRRGPGWAKRAANGGTDLPRSRLLSRARSFPGWTSPSPTRHRRRSSGSSSGSSSIPGSPRMTSSSSSSTSTSPNWTRTTGAWTSAVWWTSR